MKRQELGLRQKTRNSEILMACLIKGMGLLVVLIVGAITWYMFYKGIPFFKKYGVEEMLLRSRWEPVSENPSFGISYMIGTSVLGSLGAMALTMPIGVLTAIYWIEIAPEWLSDIMGAVIELMAGMPSIIYGLAGLTMVTPMIYDFEKLWFEELPGKHIFSGGSNLLAAILVLAVMMLPTVTITSAAAIKAVPKARKLEAMALGASKLQAVFSVVLEDAKRRLITVGILGMGRVLGETMVVSLVAGGVVNRPELFSSVRFMTTALVSEMGYAKGIHREALFSVGLILYILILVLVGGVHELAEKEKNKK